jgi:peptidoglycan/LPS O-acetylase OafA/YrhL
VTYSLYLTHFPLVLLFEHHFGNDHRPSSYSILYWGVVVASCVAFSAIFAALTERHTNSIRDVIGQKLKVQLKPMAEKALLGRADASSR